MSTLDPRRTEILMSLATAIATVVIALYATFEAYRRFAGPPQIASLALFGVAAIGASIALLMLRRASRLLHGASRVLFDRTPADLDLASVREVLATTPGVIAVHDVHVWSKDSGAKAMTAHVVVPVFEDRDDVMTALNDRAALELGIADVTIQLESSGWEAHETHR